MSRKPTIPSSEHPSIITRYKNGESTLLIGKSYQVARDTIRSILMRNGIVLDQKGGLITTAKEKQEEMIARYKAGQGANSIASDLGVSKKTVYNTLNRVGVGTRSPQTRSIPDAPTRVAMAPQYKKVPDHMRVKRGGDFRTDCFDVFDEGSCYWAGMLFTDGCLYCSPEKPNMRIWLIQGERDKEQLQKWLDWMEASRAIVYQKHDDAWGVRVVCQTSVTSAQVGSALYNMGMRPGKGKPILRDDITLHPSLCDNSHFWRGMIDGDGSFNKDCYTIRLYAGDKVRAHFVEFLSKNITTPLKWTEVVNQYGVKGVSLNTQCSCEAAWLLYNNASPNMFLPRKMRLARSYIHKLLCLQGK